MSDRTATRCITCGDDLAGTTLGGTCSECGAAANDTWTVRGDGASPRQVVTVALRLACGHGWEAGWQGAEPARECLGCHSGILIEVGFENQLGRTPAAFYSRAKTIS